MAVCLGGTAVKKTKQKTPARSTLRSAAIKSARDSNKKGASPKKKSADPKATLAPEMNSRPKPQSSVEGRPTSIVGIGASAGGLEAFEQLLAAVPQDTGMGFVLVQHLAPSHESMLSTLLARSTPMPVVEVKDGMQVKANHVYVIPPNADIDRKSTRLNSSHPSISYAVFCLK